MSSSTEARIPVGRIGRPHGLRGEVTVVPSTDNPDRFAPGSELRAGTDPPRDLVVAGARPYRNAGLIVMFEGFGDRMAAEELRGAVLTITPDQRRELADDEYWPEDLEGMAVLARDGTKVGVVSGVVLADAQDRLVIDVGDRRVEIPFVDEIVGEVHPSGGFLVVDLPEGLV